MCVCVWSVTDEEISNMRRELDKYGIQMPAFSKIGGMLASEVRVSHCAVVTDSVVCDELTCIEKYFKAEFFCHWRCLCVELICLSSPCC